MTIPMALPLRPSLYIVPQLRQQDGQVPLPTRALVARDDGDGTQSGGVVLTHHAVEGLEAGARET
jgi:hypothetical protein